MVTTVSAVNASKSGFQSNQYQKNDSLGQYQNLSNTLDGFSLSPDNKRVASKNPFLTANPNAKNYAAIEVQFGQIIANPTTVDRQKVLQAVFLERLINLNRGATFDDVQDAWGRGKPQALASFGQAFRAVQNSLLEDSEYRNLLKEIERLDFQTAWSWYDELKDETIEAFQDPKIGLRAILSKDEIRSISDKTDPAAEEAAQVEDKAGDEPAAEGAAQVEDKAGDEPAAEGAAQVEDKAGDNPAAEEAAQVEDKAGDNPAAEEAAQVEDKAGDEPAAEGAAHAEGHQGDEPVDEIEAEEQQRLTKLELENLLATAKPISVRDLWPRNPLFPFNNPQPARNRRTEEAYVAEELLKALQGYQLRHSDTEVAILCRSKDIAQFLGPSRQVVLNVLNSYFSDALLLTDSKKLLLFFDKLPVVLLPLPKIKYWTDDGVELKQVVFSANDVALKLEQMKEGQSVTASEVLELIKAMVKLARSKGANEIVIPSEMELVKEGVPRTRLEKVYRKLNSLVSSAPNPVFHRQIVIDNQNTYDRLLALKS